MTSLPVLISFPVPGLKKVPVQMLLYVSHSKDSMSRPIKLPVLQWRSPSGPHYPRFPRHFLYQQRASESRSADPAVFPPFAAESPLTGLVLTGSVVKK